MKNTKVIGYWLWVIVALLMSAPMTAQIAQSATDEQQWRTTSTIAASGSTYSPQVTPVGSPTAYTTATTTDSYNPLAGGKPTGPRKSFGENPDGGDTTDESSPIGDAVLPLMLFLGIYCAIIAIRRNKYVKLLKR